MENTVFREDELVQKCQENPWLKTFGEVFREDPFMELDYKYCFTPCKTLEELKAQFSKGNWAIRQGFIYQNLAFINQDNGGDEWWTLKKFEDGEIIAFESISFGHIIKEGGIKYPNGEKCTFAQLIEQLLKATKEQCKTLRY